jgi:hypothetical protein
MLVKPSDELEKALAHGDHSLGFGLFAIAFFVYGFALTAQSLLSGQIRVIMRYQRPYDVSRYKNPKIFWFHVALEFTFTIGAAVFAWHFLS